MEFEIKGRKFISSKMNAFDQLHVMRKLAPIFTAVGSIADLAKAMKPGPAGKVGGEGADPASPEKAGNAIALIAKAVSDMPEADLNAVLAKCCAVTKMMVGQAGFAPIWNEQAARLMFDDLDYMDLIQIVATVIQDNVGNFSDALPSMSIGRAG